MDQIKEHFENEAREFDGLIVKLIPNYPEMMRALVTAVPFDACAPIRVLDLGCGTGTIADHVVGVFPNARLTCVDLAGNMIAMARVKLAHHAQVRYVVGDFNAFGFDEHYDAVLSSLALHHLVADEDKRRFYGRIYDGLTPGGVFYNADVVLGSSDFLQVVYMREWRAFMRRSVSDNEIEGTWLPKYQAEDRPAKLIDQLAWLTAIGFTDVDVLWKHYNFAVYGGVKPR